MAVTALQMITRALRLNGDYAVGTTVSAEDAAVCLYAMNEMMQSLNLQRLMIFNVLVEEFPLIAGQSDYTIGPSAEFDTERPVALENSCFVRNGQIDYSLELINQAAYAALPDKFVQTLPSFLYYDTAFPIATIKFDCKPFSGLVLHLASRQTLQEFTGLSDQIDLPEGYQGVIEYTLAETIAPEFGHEAMMTVQQQAAKRRKWLKTVNAPNGVLATEPGIMTNNGTWNIFKG